MEDNRARVQRSNYIAQYEDDAPANNKNMKKGAHRNNSFAQEVTIYQMDTTTATSDIKNSAFKKVSL